MEAGRRKRPYSTLFLDLVFKLRAFWLFREPDITSSQTSSAERASRKDAAQFFPFTAVQKTARWDRPPEKGKPFETRQ